MGLFAFWLLPAQGNLVNVFCMALEMDREAYLRHYWFQNLEQVPLFRESCVARYQAMGSWLRTESKAKVLEGICRHEDLRG